MKAIQSHPFFKEVDWDQIWSGQPPPLESGILKRDQPFQGGDDTWNSLVASWDHAVTSPVVSDDIEWAEPELPPVTSTPPIASTSDQPTIAEAASANTRPPMSRSTTVEASASGPEIPATAALERLRHLNLTSRDRLVAEEHERGRTTMVTPVQGHGSASPVDM